MRIHTHTTREQRVSCRTFSFEVTRRPNQLASASLLAKLVDKISAAIDPVHMPIFLWSDSMIALNWISSSSRKWAVFVANRVGQIQRLTSVGSWRHVSSANNPADILSRGLKPH